MSATFEFGVNVVTQIVDGAIVFVCAGFGLWNVSWLVLAVVKGKWGGE